jgi:hypothetical protein
MTNVSITNLYPGYAFETTPIQATVAADPGVILTGLRYQWMADGKVVATTSDPSYIPVDADVGKTITVALAWTDAAGNPQQTGGSNSLLVADVNERPEGGLGVYPDANTPGLYHVQNLIRDGDGLGTFSYQWLADGKPIDGATGADLTLPAALAGQAITVMARYFDGRGHLETVLSDKPYYTYLDNWGTVTMTGAFAAGQTLHASVSDPDVPGHVYYDWQGSSDGLNWTSIAGATGADYYVGTNAPTMLRLSMVYADAQGYVEPHKVVYGSAGADSTETGQGEFLYMGAGNDTVRYLGAGATVDGGDGLDTFVAHGVMNVTRNADGSLWVSRFTGYSTALVNVERVVLSTGEAGDEALAFDANGAAGQAYRLYAAAFDRVPDEYGLGFWINRLDLGVSLDTVANAFVASAEFKSLYGAAPGNADLVASFYANVLHRTPDATGQAFWTGLLDRHVLSVADVLIQFSESAENVAALTGVMQNGIHYQLYAAV